MGVKRIGELIGCENIISADMGGTTFKVGVVREGLIEYQHESQALRYHYALPKLDIVSLGLAGGSIIWFDERTGTPRIGPRGAGSYPGPILYAHGGEDPTVTDVDAILGFMNEDYFLGGREGLEIEGAREIFEGKVADRLGLPVLEAAGAIYRLANSYIYDLLHRTTVQRGLDPRDFVLFSTGGTAGMHLPAIAAELGVGRVLVPHSASVQGAFGLVTSDVVHEECLARPMRDPEPVTVRGVFEELTERVAAQLQEDGFDPGEATLTRSVDIHYRRQVHEVTVPLRNAVAFDAEGLRALREDFEERYRQRYGRDSTSAEAEIELVTFRVRGAAPVRQPDLQRHTTAARTAEEALVETRDVFLPDEGAVTAVPCFDFERLAPGALIDGPAIVWSPITTIVVPAGHGAEVDPYRTVVIERRA
jgi:N-methylhydantoinase A